jgi:quercetin dioxygenase-like cupin family protein
VETTLGYVPTLRDVAAIGQLTKEPFGVGGGATNTVLWRDEVSMAGLLTVAGGHHLGEHSHRLNHHHIWVISGSAVIAGAPLSAGSYAHIPSGVLHDIDARDTDGCTVFYLYIRHA